jgi:hypothetical protein
MVEVFFSVAQRKVETSNEHTDETSSIDQFILLRGAPPRRSPEKT